MRNVLQLAGMLFLTACSQGSTERWLPPEEVVQRYSRTVACQIPNNSPNYRQYVTIPLDPGSNEGGFGALWLVGWSGDLGCMGGTGTHAAQLTLVMQNGFSRRAVSPVVIDPQPIPEMQLWSISHLSIDDDVITIRGQSGNPQITGNHFIEERYRWCGQSTTHKNQRFIKQNPSKPGKISCPT